MVEQKLSHVIIAVIFFTIFIVGGVSMLGILKVSDSSFGGDKYDTYNQRFNKMDDVSDRITDLQTGIESEDDQDVGVLGVLNALIMKSWQTLRLSVTSYSFMGTALTGASTMFGVPAWIITLLIGIISVIILFTILGAIFQTEL